jgi:serine/threonine protein kinase
MPAHHVSEKVESDPNDEPCELALSVHRSYRENNEIGPEPTSRMKHSNRAKEADIQKRSPTALYKSQSWRLAQQRAPRHPDQRAYRRSGEPIPGLVFEDQLVHGGQGLVELMKCKVTGELFVAKIFHNRFECENEAALLRRLHRGRKMPRIIRPVFYHGGMPYSNESTLMLEYCNMPDLFGYKDEWSERGLPIPEIDVWNIMFQLSEAVAFLHEGWGTQEYSSNPNKLTWNPVVHRDIKPENVLLHRVSGLAVPMVKLSDFGLAKYFDPTNCRESSGTALYFPPEKPVWTPPGDVWALGATIHYICTGQPPRDFSLPQAGFADIHEWAENLDFDIIPIDEAPQWRDIIPVDERAFASWNQHVYSRNLARLMYRMLNESVDGRITAVQLVVKIRHMMLKDYLSREWEDIGQDERDIWDMVASSGL